MIFLVAIVLPWLALFIRGKPIQGILSLILQLTLLGWIPAAIWAVLVVLNGNQNRRHRELIRTLDRRSP